MIMFEIEKNINDEMAVTLAKEGNRTAFRILYDRYREQTYRLAFRYMRTPQDAEDVMQDSFIKAFKRISTFDFLRSSSFSAWLHRICIHTAIEHLRKRKRLKSGETYNLGELYTEPASAGRSPDYLTELNQAMDKLRLAVNILSPQQRVIFDLRHSRHLGIKEIASEMKCSESTVKKQLFRAMTKLRKQMHPIWGAP